MLSIDECCFFHWKWINMKIYNIQFHGINSVTAWRKYYFFSCMECGMNDVKVQTVQTILVRYIHILIVYFSPNTLYSVTEYGTGIQPCNYKYFNMIYDGLYLNNFIINNISTSVSCQPQATLLAINTYFSHFVYTHCYSSCTIHLWHIFISIRFFSSQLK